MKRLSHFLAALGGLFLFLSPVQSAEKLETVVDRMKKDIFYLAGEECEGRGVETDGIHKAADYIAAEFKRLGVKPAMKDGTYFQSFAIRGMAKQGNENSLVLNGPTGQEFTTKHGPHFTVSGLTDKGKISTGVVFAGYGITIGPKDYDDYRGVNVEGKIVIVFRQTPRAKSPLAPLAPDAARHASLVSKIDNAEQHKAAGVIFVNDRDMAGTKDDLPPFDYSRGQGGATIPVLHLRREIVDQMLAASGTTLLELEASIDNELKPRTFEVKGWKATIQTSVERTDLKAKNIIGYLEGAGPLANETIVIGAHYDHLGRGERGSRSKGSKAVHFGADDNGSGTTSVIELARRFAGMKDRQGRRIVFMLFSGEERGLLGSAYYCNREPVFPLKDTVAMINLDMVGRLRNEEVNKKFKLEIGGIGSAKGFEKMIDTMNEKYQFNITKTRSGTGPSDHTSFYMKEVPVFFLFTGFHPEYHMPTDKPDLINVEGMAKICDMVEEITTKISTTKERPEYVKGVTGKSPSMSGALPTIGFMPGQYDDDETRGVPVGGVTPGGPADKGGIKSGDWIIDVAGRTIKNMDGYMNAMTAQRRGMEIEITILRGKEKLKLKVTPQ